MMRAGRESAGGGGAKAARGLSEAWRRELDEKYCQVPVQNSVRLETYFNTAKQLYIAAGQYFKNRDLMNAYIFYRRFAKLVVEGIPSHNAYRSATYQTPRSWARRHGQEALDRLQEVVDMLDEAELRKQQDELIDEFDADGEGDAAPGSDGYGGRSGGGSGDGNGEGDYSAIGDADEKRGARRTHVEQDAKQELKSLSDAFAVLKPPSEVATTTTTSHGESGGSSLMLDSDALKKMAMGRSSREMVMPTALVQQFARIAEPNTLVQPDGVETCGILAGCVQKDSRLLLNTLIIPKQEGTANTCSMTNEEELFEFCLNNDLITLGWIHTHPRQTCFLSAVDLHTHCGYQTMLPEAVAIVVAPIDTEKQVGVFRLTEPAGLTLIQTCPLTGFHPHEADFPIYEDVPGIVWTNDSFTVVDLRSS